MKRKILTDPVCPICGVMVETEFHALWECPGAMDVWGVGPIKFQKSSYAGPSFLEMVEELFRKSFQEEMAIFVGIARRIWMRRNDVVYGGNFTHPTTIVHMVSRAVEEFREAQDHEITAVTDAAEARMTRWVAPAQGWLKANWDASLDSKAGRMGCGVVIRDYCGNMIEARSWSLRGNVSPAAAELIAAQLAIDTCSAMGVTHIQLEGDAKGVVDAVNCEEPDSSSLGHLVEDIKVKLQSFIQWKMCFVKRAGNQAAHGLSRFAVKQGLDDVWTYPPDCIRDLILLEQVALAE
jgi:ribonuclease HI